jgi:hypothetical protein
VQGLIRHSYDLVAGNDNAYPTVKWLFSRELGSY